MILLAAILENLGNAWNLYVILWHMNQIYCLYLKLLSNDKNKTFEKAWN